MELSNIRETMKRKAKKENCPLVFDRLEYGDCPFQSILSEEKLDEVLAYLLRVKSFRQYAMKTIINNVYMDWDMFHRKPRFRRTRSVIERNRIYAGIQRLKKRLHPDYDKGLCMEITQCVFRFPEAAEKYRVLYNGQETYAFLLSNRHIFDLFACCKAAGKLVVSDGAGYRHLEEQKAALPLTDKLPEEAGTVLFQALLLDDVEYSGSELSAKFCTIYCFHHSMKKE